MAETEQDVNQFETLLRVARWPFQWASSAACGRCDHRGACDSRTAQAGSPSHDVGASNGMYMSILLLLRFKVIYIRSRQDGTSSRWTSMANYRHPVVSGEVTGLMSILCLPVVALPTHVSCCVQERSPDNQLNFFPLVVSFEVSCPLDT